MRCWHKNNLFNYKLWITLIICVFHVVCWWNFGVNCAKYKEITVFKELYHFIYIYIILRIAYRGIFDGDSPTALEGLANDGVVGFFGSGALPAHMNASQIPSNHGKEALFAVLAIPNSARKKIKVRRFDSS